MFNETHFIYPNTIEHCRQRAPIENVWSTSGIFKSGIFKADTDNYRKYL